MKTWSYWRLFSSDFWGFHSLTWIDLDCGSPWHKYRAVIGPELPGIIRSSRCLQKSPAQKTPSVFSVLQHSSCFKNYARAYLISCLCLRLYTDGILSVGPALGKIPTLFTLKIFPALSGTSKISCKTEHSSHAFLLPLSHLAHPIKGRNTICCKRHKLFFHCQYLFRQPIQISGIVWYNPLHFWSLPTLSSCAILLPQKKAFK